jgi:hypothetical protein
MFLSAGKALLTPAPVLFGAASAGGATTGTSLSYTHTPLAIDNWVFVAITSYSLASAPGNPTYGGTSMGAPLVNLNIASADFYSYLWGLQITPGAGAKTVAHTFGSGFNCSGSVSYSNVAKLGTPQSSGASAIDANVTVGNINGLYLFSGSSNSTTAPGVIAVTPQVTRFTKAYSSGVNYGLIMGDYLYSNNQNFIEIVYSGGTSGDVGVGAVPLLAR